MIHEIKKVCFVGAGNIGCWNALFVAAAGYDVAVYDVSTEMLSAAPQRLEAHLAMAVAAGLVDEETAKAGLERIVLTDDPQKAAADADLLSESVPENVELKRKVFAQFDQLCPEKTIFTTNTSSLLVSELEDAVGRRDRFAALHFHLLGLLVDIVAGPRAEAALAPTLERFVRSIAMVPIVHTVEKEGYLYNSLLILHLKNAVMLVVNGYGTPENVDRSIMASSFSQVGPFAQLDFAGLDLAMMIFEEQHARIGDIEFKQAADYLRPYVERGELGMKTGQGFYSYPNPAWQQPDFL